jgi:hypothetical protein
MSDDSDDAVSALVVDSLRMSEDALDYLAGDDPDTDLEELIDDIQTVAEEAIELLETMDLSELPSAINEDELDELVVGENLPEAVANLDPDEAIRLRKLLAVVDLAELWGSVDVRDAWRNKRELEDAVDDVGDDDGGDDGLVSNLTDDEDEEDDDFGVDFDAEQTLETGEDDMNVPDQAYETAIQSQLADSVEQFRQGLVEVHQKLARMREENKQRTESAEQPSSRNPTAASTLASTGTRSSADVKYSTVPRETKYSSAPNRTRIYGSRFDEYEGDDA